MTTLLLIRHAATDAVGKRITGWQPGWHLNANGKSQANRLAQRLAELPIRAVYTSPLERAVETALPIAAARGLEPVAIQELGEARMGSWEGRTFDELGERPADAEPLHEVQTRMIEGLRQLAESHPDDMLAVVSHSAPLRCAIAHFMDIPLHSLERFEISPASVTAVIAGQDWWRVVCVNATPEILP